jgi:D-3-phosphoglycerate dehydrogenase / 2-oxoglutarate reductase
MQQKYFIIDFDSTFTQVEALDELAKISLKNHPEKIKRTKEIALITDRAMDGKIPFDVALDKRIKLLQAHQSHVAKLTKILSSKISPSFSRNKDFFKKYHDNIFIISGGFKEFIVPIVSKLGVDEEKVFANTFIFNNKNYIVGCDKNNPLSRPGGKVELLKSLNIEGDIYVIGDGYTDYQLREAGLANRFYAFTENVERGIVTGKADHIAPSLDEILFVNKLPMAISYPKNRIKVLLLENIHDNGFRKFKEEGYQIETHSKNILPEDLKKNIAEISILGIRSKTNITKETFDSAKRLMTIGTFCIGTDQVDLDEATKRGIPVFNAPYSNTRSVVEMTVGAMIMLMRQVPEKNSRMHAGIWDKTANGSHEIRGKKLGIVGYGKIGTQLSIIAEALGMEVLFYDIAEKLALGNAQLCQSLDELLRKADVVTLHVDGNKRNKDFFGEKQFRQMKNGTIFLNMSRGFIVDVEALASAMQSGKITGAAIDVFPIEPSAKDDPFESVLQNIPNVILTPHIGGSTEEAQENIAKYVPAKIIEYINTGNTMGSVNFPNVQLPPLTNAHRLLHVHKNVPGILAKINKVFAANNINILSQHLKTNELIGYVITDVAKDYDQNVIKELRKIPNTIKFRILY